MLDDSPDALKIVREGGRRAALAHPAQGCRRSEPIALFQPT